MVATFIVLATLTCVDDPTLIKHIHVNEVDKNATLHIEGDVSNSQDPSLTIPRRVKADIPLSKNETITFHKAYNPTIPESYNRRNCACKICFTSGFSYNNNPAYIIEIQHIDEIYAPYIDLLGKLKYEIKYSGKVLKGEINLVEQYRPEFPILDWFDNSFALDKNFNMVHISTEENHTRIATQNKSLRNHRRYEVKFKYISDADKECKLYFTYRLSNFTEKGWIFNEPIKLQLVKAKIWRDYKTRFKSLPNETEGTAGFQIEGGTYGHLWIKDFVVTPLGVEKNPVGP